MLTRNEIKALDALLAARGTPLKGPAGAGPSCAEFGEGLRSFRNGEPGFSVRGFRLSRKRWAGLYACLITTRSKGEVL